MEQSLLVLIGDLGAMNEKGFANFTAFTGVQYYVHAKGVNYSPGRCKVAFEPKSALFSDNFKRPQFGYLPGRVLSVEPIK